MGTARAGRHDRLSIKQVADLAGVSTRAVRHYHEIGLLPEPARDNSGYRRYGGRDVVALVRISRLRSLGMPLPQIAERLAAAGEDDGSLSDALRVLAAEIDAEIDQLVRTRDRLRTLAESETFDQPAQALTRVLQERGVLGPTDRLRAGEGWAAAVLDALHPQGMPGVIDQASPLLGDPQVLGVLAALRRRLARLRPDTPTEDIAALAADVADLLAQPGAGRSVLDIDLVDLLLADRLNPTQRRFMEQLRERMEQPR